MVPKHIGYILDGNRRWARQHSIPEYDGHLAGYNALREVIRATFESGVEYISIYAFSTENWKRDPKEVSSLMKLVVYAFKHDLKSLMKEKIRVRFLGTRDSLSVKILGVLDKAEEATKDFNGRTLAICFNYGGQQEIVDAVRACGDDGIAASEITDEDIAAHLYATDIPAVDMVVRTSGEQRISNFMLWRIAYSEFMFVDKFWPDMGADDVKLIIDEYNRRNRRFGGN